MRNISKKSNSVSEAIDTRLTCRAFLDKKVDKKIIEEIINVAKRAPSGGNLQPWHMWVVSGNPLKKFKKNIADKIEKNPFGEGTEYKI